MKIVHVIAGLDNGGAEGALYRLATADTGNHHEIISMMGSGTYGERLRAAGIPVHTLSMPRGRVTVGGVAGIYRLVRAIRPDVVQTWMYHADLLGGIVARLAGQRAVTWGIRASDAHEHTSLMSRALVRVCARLSRRVPANIVFVSQAGAVVHRRMGYCGDKSRVISNGYDTVELAPDPVARDRQRDAWRIPPESALIGMVARWDPLKDHETLFAALTALREAPVGDWLCVLIGSGMTPDNRDLTALLHRYRILDRVRLVGPVGAIAPVMNALDVHVLSSKSEAFPNVVAEAMACGVPCVATRVGDAGLIVGSTGWLVPPSDGAAMTRALREALTERFDAAQWARRKAACRSRILASFSLTRMVASYNTVWQEALGAGGASQEPVRVTPDGLLVGASRRMTVRIPAAFRRRSRPTRSVFSFLGHAPSPNVDPAVVRSFGEEWERFDQAALPEAERNELFAAYFKIFPWNRVSPDAVGFDAGCGTGRWALLVAPRVGHLHCIEPSSAIQVAARNLRHLPNCSFHQATVDNMPLADDSMDFGYALGVLHHLPDTAQGLASCVRKLKKGSPFLVYLYYAFDNQPPWFRAIWRVSEGVRFILSRLPGPVKYACSQAIAGAVYWPLARTARLWERANGRIHSFPLSAYRHRSFYSMRTDALDRFGTPLERRFTRAQITAMMEAAGLEQVEFSPDVPFWCGIGFKR